MKKEVLILNLQQIRDDYINEKENINKIATVDRCIELIREFL